MPIWYYESSVKFCYSHSVVLFFSPMSGYRLARLSSPPLIGQFHWPIICGVLHWTRSCAVVELETKGRQVRPRELQSLTFICNFTGFSLSTYVSVLTIAPYCTFFIFWLVSCISQSLNYPSLLPSVAMITVCICHAAAVYVLQSSLLTSQLLSLTLSICFLMYLCFVVYHVHTPTYTVLCCSIFSLSGS